MEFLLNLLILLICCWGFFWLLRPEEAKHLQEKIKKRFFSPSSNSVDPLLEQESALLGLIRNHEWVRLEQILQQGTSKEQLYNRFAQLKEWENGAQFAERLKDSEVVRWFYQEGFLCFLENRKWNRALSLAKRARFHEEAYLLFSQLYPEGNWLERGALALNAKRYEEAFQYFIQGNEIQAATKVAAALNSLDLLFSLTQGRAKTTIKVLILDTLEDLRQMELREQLIQKIKAIP